MQYSLGGASFVHEFFICSSRDAIARHIASTTPETRPRFFTTAETFDLTRFCSSGDKGEWKVEARFEEAPMNHGVLAFSGERKVEVSGDLIGG